MTGKACPLHPLATHRMRIGQPRRHANPGGDVVQRGPMRELAAMAAKQERAQSHQAAGGLADLGQGQARGSVAVFGSPTITCRPGRLRGWRVMSGRIAPASQDLQLSSRAIIRVLSWSKRSRSCMGGPISHRISPDLRCCTTDRRSGVPTAKPRYTLIRP